MIGSRLGPIMVAAVLAACSSQTSNQNEATAPEIAAPDAGKSSAIAGAIADPNRAFQAADDPTRKPVEILAFTGVKGGDKVFELIPGTGYWTRLFSGIVGPTGHVYAVWPQQYARFSVGKVEALTAAADKAPYENVSVKVEPTPALTAPEQVDIMFTSQNYHDYPAEFMGSLKPSVLNDAAFAMLKPGGTYIIIDHAGAPGSGMEKTPTLHRIDPATVRSQVEAAGFVYEGSSDALRRDGDRYDLPVFDPKVRGKTDKFALKFRKPTK